MQRHLTGDPPLCPLPDSFLLLMNRVLIQSRDAWGRNMNYGKIAIRNREIWFSYRDGESIEKLAQLHRLTLKTIDQIIRHQRHKVVARNDAAYEETYTHKIRLQRWDKP